MKRVLIPILLFFCVFNCGLGNASCNTYLETIPLTDASQLLGRLMRPSYIIGKEARSRARSELHRDLYDATYVKKLPTQMIRDLAWVVFTQTPHPLALVDIDLKMFLLNAYLSRIGQGEGLAVNNVGLVDWLSLVTRDGFHLTFAFRKYLSFVENKNFVLRWTSAVKMSLKSGEELNSHHLDLFIDFLASHIESKKSFVISSEGRSDVLYRASVGDNLGLLADIEVLKSKPAFFTLIKDVTDYLDSKPDDRRAVDAATQLKGTFDFTLR